MQTPFGHDVPVYDMERMICDVLRSLSRKNAADAQILMRNYMAEKLETIDSRGYAESAGSPRRAAGHGSHERRGRFAFESAPSFFVILLDNIGFIFCISCGP